MSMSAEVHDTILLFCIENNITQEKAVALLCDIVDDMNGDGDTYDFSFVSTAYAASNNAAQQRVQPTCATCGDSGRGLPTLSNPDGAENACRDCGSIG